MNILFWFGSGFLKSYKSDKSFTEIQSPIYVHYKIYLSIPSLQKETEQTLKILISKHKTQILNFKTFIWTFRIKMRACRHEQWQSLISMMKNIQGMNKSLLQHQSWDTVVDLHSRDDCMYNMLNTINRILKHLFYEQKPYLI